MSRYALGQTVLLNINLRYNEAERPMSRERAEAFAAEYRKVYSSGQFHVKPSGDGWVVVQDVTPEAA